jgi:hypothetical protein
MYLPRTKDQEKAFQEEKARQSFKKGSTFGIEDETRYQASKLGSLGGFPTVAPFTPEAASKPSPAAAPIANSPEIQQAKDRVKTYEDDILSGKVSEDIYGKSKQPSQTQQASFIKSSNNEADDYQLDLNNSQTAAQSQLQQYLSKYSKYKSNN